VANDGAQESDLGQVALCELDYLGVLVSPGEDDDDAVDHSLLSLDIRLVDDAIAVRVHGLGLDGARAAHIEHPLVLEDGLDRALVLEAGDHLEARWRRVVGVGRGVRGLLEDIDLAGNDDVDVVARRDQEVEAGHAVHLE
jgi:hypothetical protein